MTALEVNGKQVMERTKCRQIEGLIQQYASRLQLNTEAKMQLWSKLHNMHKTVDEIVIGGLGAKYPSKEWEGTWAAMCKRENKGKKVFAGTTFLNEVWPDIWTIEESVKMLGAFRACPPAP